MSTTIPFHGAWSIGNSNRGELIVRTDSPGPGAYDEHRPMDTPKWSLKGKHQNDSAFYVKDHIPAPGEYEAQTFLKIAKPTKSSKEFSPSNQKVKSGPSYYSGSYINLASAIEVNRGFAFGYRSEVTVPDLSPGPSINVNERLDLLKSQKIKNKASGFGYGAKNSIYKDSATDTPGPGKYDWNKQNKEIRSSVGGNILFSKDQRKLVHNLTCHDLGPGQYHPVLPTCEKGCRMQGRYKPQKSDSLENIGPGSYKLPETKSPTAVRFVESRRQDMKDKNTSCTPSPFQYNPKRFPEAYKCNEGFRIGYAERKSTYDCEKTPGPGSYQVAAGLNKQGVTIATKLKNSSQLSSSLKKIDSGSVYNPNYDYVANKPPAFSFTTQMLPVDRQAKPSKTGPGAYNSHDLYHTEKYSIGRADRFKQKTDNPNDYFSVNLPAGVGFIPKYLLKAKKDG